LKAKSKMQKTKSLQVKNKKIYDIRKRCYIFALAMINLIRRLPKRDLSAEVIGRQVLRSATSIGANVVEGQSSSSKKDFINFHQHALKSANETKFWLGLVRDSKILDRPLVSPKLEECSELAKIIATIVISAKNKRF